MEDEGLPGRGAALISSNWNNGDNASTFNWNLNNAATNVNRNIGTQLTNFVNNRCPGKPCLLAKHKNIKNRVGRGVPTFENPGIQQRRGLP